MNVLTDSDLDTNEESNKQLPYKSKTNVIYESTESEYSKSDNNDNDKSVLRVEKNQKMPKQNWTFTDVKDYHITWIHNATEIIWQPSTWLMDTKTIFWWFFDESLYKHIPEQTNLYLVEVTGNSIKTDKNENQQFIVILNLFICM